MNDDTSVRAPRGRQREAELNDARLLQAAFEVFAEQGWDAPVSAIAGRAGIGMGSLYRRYSSKEELAQRLRILSMEQLTALARTACVEEPDPWSALTLFLRACLTAPSPTGGLLAVLGRRLPADDRVRAAARSLRLALDALVTPAHQAGVLRTDFVSADIPLLLEHLAPRIPAGGERTAALHLRHLELVLAGLRAAPRTDPPALPGPAPLWAELGELWNADQPSAAEQAPANR